MLALKNINSAAAKILCLNDVDIENVVLSKKQKNGKQKKRYKYFIGHRWHYKTKPFSMILTEACAKKTC